MLTTGDQIITIIESDVKLFRQPTNIFLQDDRFKLGVTYQYLLGCVSINRYTQDNMIYETGIRAMVGEDYFDKTYQFGYDSLQVNELRDALNIINRHYQIDANIESMIDKLQINHFDNKMVYIVITRVKLPVLVSNR